jgi:hypothetical protein
MAMASRFTSKRAIKMLAAPQKQFMAVDEESSAASSSCVSSSSYAASSCASSSCPSSSGGGKRRRREDEEEEDPAARAAAVRALAHVGVFRYDAGAMHASSLQLLRELEHWWAQSDRLRSILLRVIDPSAESHVALRPLTWLVTNYARNRGIFIVRDGVAFNVERQHAAQLDLYKRRNIDTFRRGARVYFFIPAAAAAPAAALVDAAPTASAAALVDAAPTASAAALVDAAAAAAPAPALLDAATAAPPAAEEEVLCETTVAQLNFIKWAHLNGVIQYAHENMAAIMADQEAAMVQTAERKREERTRGQKPKRAALSRGVESACTVVDMIAFNSALDVSFDPPSSSSAASSAT